MYKFGMARRFGTNDSGEELNFNSLDKAALIWENSSGSSLLLVRLGESQWEPSLSTAALLDTPSCAVYGLLCSAGLQHPTGM